MKEWNINKAFEVALPKKQPIFKFSAEELAALTKVSQILLAVIAGAGILTLAVVAPNIFGALGRISRMTKSGKHWSREEKKTKIKNAFYYLKRSGLIKLTGRGGETKVEVTAKGQEQLASLHFKSLQVPKTKVWDGDWWLVAADIPTKDYRWAADMFRRKLKDMGFFTLQRTLWFYPFNPIGEIQFVAEQFGIQKYITVMEVVRIDVEDEKKMKEFFIARGVL